MIFSFLKNLGTWTRQEDFKSFQACHHLTVKELLYAPKLYMSLPNPKGMGTKQKQGSQLPGDFIT